MDAKSIRELWMAITELARHDKAEPINKHPDVWRRKVDGWEFVVNGHTKELRMVPLAGAHVDLPPFHLLATQPENVGVYICCSPHEGTESSGAVDDLVKAIRKELVKQP